MATTLASLIIRARDQMNAATDPFWSDAELLRYMNGAINDLFRRIKDSMNDDFFVEDSTNVSVAANTRALAGVPTNIAEIRGIRARTLAAYPNLVFVPRKWTDYDFQAQEPTPPVGSGNAGIVFYAMTGTGGPVAAVNILIAPTLAAAVPLTIAYVPSRTEITVASTVNPIPGESDMALVYYTVAHALGRTPHGDQQSVGPRAEWLALFEQECSKIVVATTPRQSDEPDYVEALFESYW